MSALRIAHPGLPTVLIDQRDPYWSLTQRQRHILDVVRGHNGNRSRAARQLGISATAVQASLRVAAAAGVSVVAPPRFGAGRGPDLQPRANKPSPCGALMPLSGCPCARGRGHVGGHRSLRSETSERAAQSRSERFGSRHGRAT